MKLAFSTNAYLKFSFPETVRRLAKIGYTGVEIMADVPHAWPAFMLDEQKQAIRQALTDKLVVRSLPAKGGDVKRPAKEIGVTEWNHALRLAQAAGFNQRDAMLVDCSEMGAFVDALETLLAEPDNYDLEPGDIDLVCLFLSLAKECPQGIGLQP